MKETEKQIVKLCIKIVGEEWTGKSSAANTIMGQPIFQVDRDTEVASQSSGVIDGRNVTVVDTPGWDSQCFSAEPLKILTKAYVSESVKCQGIDVLLLTIPISHDQNWNLKVAQRLSNALHLFNEDIWKHTMLLFTRADQLNSSGFEGYLDGSGQPFHSLIEKCDRRYHVINNRNKKDRKQIRELLEKVERMVWENDSYLLQLITEKKSVTEHEMETPEHSEQFEERYAEEHHEETHFKLEDYMFKSLPPGGNFPPTNETEHPVDMQDGGLEPTEENRALAVNGGDDGDTETSDGDQNAMNIFTEVEQPGIDRIGEEDEDENPKQSAKGKDKPLPQHIHQGEKGKDEELTQHTTPNKKLLQSIHEIIKTDVALPHHGQEPPQNFDQVNKEERYQQIKAADKHPPNWKKRGDTNEMPRHKCKRDDKKRLQQRKKVGDDHTLQRNVKKDEKQMMDHQRNTNESEEIRNPAETDDDRSINSNIHGDGGWGQLENVNNSADARVKNRGIKRTRSPRSIDFKREYEEEGIHKTQGGIWEFRRARSLDRLDQFNSKKCGDVVLPEEVQKGEEEEDENPKQSAKGKDKPLPQHIHQGEKEKDEELTQHTTPNKKLLQSIHEIIKIDIALPHHGQEPPQNFDQVNKEERYQQIKAADKHPPNWKKRGDTNEMPRHKCKRDDKKRLQQRKKVGDDHTLQRNVKKDEKQMMDHQRNTNESEEIRNPAETDDDRSINSNIHGDGGWGQLENVNNSADARVKNRGIKRTRSPRSIDFKREYEEEGIHKTQGGIWEFRRARSLDRLDQFNRYLQSR